MKFIPCCAFIIYVFVYMHWSLNLNICACKLYSTSRRKSCFSSGMTLSSAKALLTSASFNMTLTASRLWPSVLNFVDARDKCCDQQIEKIQCKLYYFDLKKKTSFPWIFGENEKEKERE